MKALVLKSWLLCGATGMLICCNTGKKESFENTVRWDSLAVDRSGHFMDADTNPGCSLQIKFVYPVDFSDANVLKATARQFIADCFGDRYADMTPQKAAEEYAQEFIRTFKKDEQEFLEEKKKHPAEAEDSWGEVYEISNNQILYNRNNLLGVLSARESYQGGAHSVHYYTSRVIDLTTGSRITEKEIFIDECQDDLAKIIAEEIVLSNNVDNVSELENIGFFDIGEIKPNGNFYVDDTGIAYIYNEYEIAAYALGAITVHLPYEKIRHLLRQDSPIASIAL
ncbi:MAG: RsiV family protein [Tannerella sp.]|jgi:hypothetical protein|nr:RsiV family protein [Tannerella sp.]